MWQIDRTNAPQARVFGGPGDTHAGLADLLGLQADELDAWLTRPDGAPPEDPVGEVPNTIVFVWAGDLGDLIQALVKAFGPERCMWESDCPFQVVEGHRYADSIGLIETKLKFLTAGDREWLLRKTAEKFFFPA